MSAGEFANSKYESNGGLIFPIKIQPETLGLLINSVTNAEPTNPVGAGLPSAKVSGSRRSIGVNVRKVRFRFTGAIPDGYLAVGGVLTLPVLTSAAYDAYQKSTDGTYTLNGTAYPVEFVGKTPETIN